MFGLEIFDFGFFMFELGMVSFVGVLFLIWVSVGFVDEGELFG